MKILFALAISFLVQSSQAETSYSEVVSPEVRKAAQALGASLVSEVTFEPGSHSPNQEEMAELASAVKEAKKSNKIKEVQVIAWADVEYPADSQRGTNSTIKLANRRAKAIENFLTQELEVSRVKKINMAKQPSALQNALGTKTADVKNTLLESGAVAQSPVMDPDIKGKASKALVLIYTK